MGRALHITCCSGVAQRPPESGGQRGPIGSREGRFLGNSCQHVALEPPLARSRLRLDRAALLTQEGTALPEPDANLIGRSCPHFKDAQKKLQANGNLELSDCPNYKILNWRTAPDESQSNPRFCTFGVELSDCPISHFSSSSELVWWA